MAPFEDCALYFEEIISQVPIMITSFLNLVVFFFMAEPGAPQNVKATVMSPSQIRLQWDPPLQSSGSLTAYLIYQV